MLHPRWHLDQELVGQQVEACQQVWQGLQLVLGAHHLLGGLEGFRPGDFLVELHLGFQAGEDRPEGDHVSSSLPTRSQIRRLSAIKLDLEDRRPGLHHVSFTLFSTLFPLIVVIAQGFQPPPGFQGPPGGGRGGFPPGFGGGR